MVLLPENGYSSGTYKVPIGAPIVAVIILFCQAACMGQLILVPLPILF